MMPCRRKAACSPKRRYSTASHARYSNVTSFAGGTLLTIPPINQTTLAGETAQFTCVSKDKDAVVTWYKDGVPLSSIPDLNNRASTSNGSLIISPTDVTDPGEYSCAVKNSRGDKQTASAYLNVQCEYKRLTVSMHTLASLYKCMYGNWKQALSLQKGNVAPESVMGLLKANLWIENCRLKASSKKKIETHAVRLLYE